MGAGNPMEIAKLILEYLKTLVWPITVIFLSVFFRKSLVEILRRIKKAALPGGVSLDFQEEIKQVKELSQETSPVPAKTLAKKSATIPLTEANARMIALGLKPVSSGLDLDYFRNIAANDPTLALAGLRIDLETLIRNLATGFSLEIKTYQSPSTILKQLLERGAVTENQAELGKKILAICNKAVHGQPVSYLEAREVIDATDALFENYLQWLSWGFGDDWQPPNAGH
jgi:hypothetical protein